MSNKIKNIDSKKSNRSISAHKVDLSKLDSSEETMSLYTYPNEFLKLNLDKIREFIEIVEEHYINMVQQGNISKAKAAKQRLILLRNLEKEKMKKEAKIIYSNQRELIQDKMNEELDNYIDAISEELNNLLKIIESNELEMITSQKKEIEELKKNFNYIYESQRKPSTKMLNLIKMKNYAVKQNKFEKAEDVEKDIEDLNKKENKIFENEKEKALKKEIEKLSKYHEVEKNNLLNKKNNLINMFNQTKKKNVNAIKKKYENKMKELINYQSFELSTFDKITKKITKPFSRIQNIINSTAFDCENENKENSIGNENINKKDSKNNNNKNEEISEKKTNDIENMKNNNDKHNEIIINKNSNRQKNDKGAKNNNHCDEKEYLFCYEEKIDAKIDNKQI